MVPDLAPMLADRGLPSGGLDGWAVEPKLDGWRVTVAVHAGRVTVRTRRGHVITGSVPGIDALGDLGVDLLLDGELVAGAGRACDFYALMPHVARRPGAVRVPLSFWAFDVLFHDGATLTGSSYRDRRQVLEGLSLPTPCRVLPRWPATVTADLLTACGEFDVEGVVLKRLRSIYRPGERSRHWRKVKSPGWAAMHAPRRAPSAELLTAPLPQAAGSRSGRVLFVNVHVTRAAESEDLVEAFPAAPVDEVVNLSGHRTADLASVVYRFHLEGPDTLPVQRPEVLGVGHSQQGLQRLDRGVCELGRVVHFPEATAGVGVAGVPEGAAEAAGLDGGSSIALKNLDLEACGIRALGGRLDHGNLR